MGGTLCQPNYELSTSIAPCASQRAVLRTSLMKKINVRKLRERLGLSRIELADKVGLTERAVRAWEAGVRTPIGPARKILEQLADAP